MTSKLTKERIEWLNYAATGLAANGTEMAMSPQDVIALTECCLAAMDSEPVAFINGAWTLVYYRPPKESGLKIGDKLYRHAQPAPECQHQWKFGGANKLQSQKQCIKCGRVELDAQQPVVPDEITSASAPEVFEIAAEAERLGLRGTYASYAVGWNACRAAMLQVGNSPVIPDGLIGAVNRLLDSDGSRGCYSAIRCGDAHDEIERLLAAAQKEVKS